ncbi:hypothetical protein SAMN05216319_4223 [Duganella sp. CF402]|uniref:hypothetical protein n=1 Tax=unclassified Duganella TaxID=2636909 RepID=UPI0008ADFD84|nr:MULTISPECIES: hypothetical protein [unclassified Duganella]RZT04000.1 hypothetical protein EV582_4881 [Duganella sp. BK701]SEM51897.1 hypothetical protein SAMN05216319_4223 [Duganella sp. CF402]
MKWSLTLLQFCLAGAACAGNLDAVRSCQDKMLPPFPPSARELMVVIDQTTPLSPALQQSVANNLKPFLAAGNNFSVVVFSAYTQGHYTDMLTSGKLDAALPAEVRNEVAKPLLAKLDLCQQRQPQQAAQAVGQALRTAFQGASSNIAKSDIFASLKSVSTVIKQSTAADKVVLIVSDMLENSSVANFYADQGHSVRNVVAAKELRAVEDNRLLADFGGARVYVIGAGLLADDAAHNKSYRDPKTMQALQAFWSEYFNKSNARLMEFGQPALLNPVR